MRRRVVAVGAVVGAGLVIALVLAFFVSPFASSQPDGLNKVAIDKGFAGQEQSHATASGPLAGYSTQGVTNARISKGLAGVIGVAVTFAIGSALFFGMKAWRRRGGVAPGPAPAVAGGEGPGSSP